MSQTHTQAEGLRRAIMPVKLPPPVNPALLREAERRGASAQNRAADAITAFSGSMTFVYLHVAWFASWIGFGVEKYPFGLLTMIVSLEAIFLSTFVLISQNRADAKRQVIADQQWKMLQGEEQAEEHEDQALLDLSKQMHQELRALTREVRALSGAQGPAAPPAR